MADQAAGDGEECFVDVGAAFVAQSESSVLVEPGDGAFDDPALAAEPGAVAAVDPGDLGFDAALLELFEDAVDVVAAVAE